LTEPEFAAAQSDIPAANFMVADFEDFVNSVPYDLRVQVEFLF
jgi:hypothetical protein